MTFGFSNGENPHKTIYHDYIGKSVRVDVSGGVGATGVIKECVPHDRGHIFYLSPYVFYLNGMPNIVSNEEVLINTNGSPVSIYPLGKSLESFVEETKKYIENQNSKKVS